MVLGLLAIAAIPTVTGVWVSASNQEESSHSEDELMRKFNLQCYCRPNSPSARCLNNGRVVLRNSKLYIISKSTKPLKEEHPLESFYIAYPDPDRPKPAPIGLVSTISDDPPVLNWVYVDKHTRELKYGNRTQSRAHLVGSWSWESGAEGGPGGLSLEGVEAAVAVQCDDGAWEIRWEDGKGEVGVRGREVLRVSLERKMLEPIKEDEQVAEKGTYVGRRQRRMKRRSRKSGSASVYEIESTTGRGLVIDA